MRFGVLLPPDHRHSADPDWLRTVATAIEDNGFDEIAVVEHTAVVADTASTYPYAKSGRSPLADDVDLPDPIELLTFMAACTSRITLSTAVLVLPNHHPVMLAKRLATLDRLAHGRVRICVGMGWMREEIEACGGTFAGRGAVADESIEVMRALWADAGPGGASQCGEHYSFERVHSWPKPSRPNGVPIYIGGHSDAAARRAGRLGNGFQPLGIYGDKLAAKLEVMKEAADQAGRDRSEIDLVLGSTLSKIDRAQIDNAERLGASTIVLSPAGPSGVDDLLADLTDCATRLGLRSPASRSSP